MGIPNMFITYLRILLLRQAASFILKWTKNLEKLYAYVVSILEKEGPVEELPRLCDSAQFKGSVFFNYPQVYVAEGDTT